MCSWTTGKLGPRSGIDQRCTNSELARTPTTNAACSPQAAFLFAARNSRLLQVARGCFQNRRWRQALIGYHDAIAAAVLRRVQRRIGTVEQRLAAIAELL